MKTNRYKGLSFIFVFESFLEGPQPTAEMKMNIMNLFNTRKHEDVHKRELRGSTLTVGSLGQVPALIAGG